METPPRRKSHFHRRPSTQRRVNTTVPLTLYDRVLALEKQGVYLSFSALLTEALERAVQQAEALTFNA